MKQLYAISIILSMLYFVGLANEVNAEAKYNYPLPKHEVRAVWLTTIGGLDWPHCYSQSTYSAEKQKQELRNILDKLQKAGINTVLIQTRIRGTMIYPSQFEPWDGCLSGVPGKSPGYDALKFAIDECHKRGMEIHAWIVTIPVGKWNSFGCKQLRQKYPGVIKKIGPEGYMNPENPQTARYLADICEEITHNYDVDGIHLDYIRYPEMWNICVSRDKGREYITSIVSNIHNKVKALKPWVKISCSPIGKYDDLSRYWSHGWNAYNKVCQDAQGWLRDGLMDELFPMMYFQDNQFFPFAIDWVEQSFKRIIAPGLGIYFMSPQEANWNLSSITREMEILRLYNVGHAYFRSKFFTDNVKGIYDFATNEFDKYPTLIPPMTWEHYAPPIPPTSFCMKSDSKTNSCEITWDGAKDRSNAPYLLYNIYSSKSYPVDVNDVRNLIISRIKDSRIIIPSSLDKRYYAITAIDRYGNESTSLQCAKLMSNDPSGQLLWCDGQYLQIPSKEETIDAGIVAIETMQGSIIATMPNTGAKISVSKIKDGFYLLRSINAKGVSHRLGFFIIKRK